ncbi:hypothetical protein [Actimicrobium sp. CCI2.3]|uniref:hypothetical protein n=1 Tax=Actimicrobium sp. CCI2.3 TaxID=3048616 RepID=UPI002AB336F1|nr:hypothetical protein [Actimicrobium sp. CCI2.3]MDY7576089.1 hypothetical protein [Actimicrobium sp. CCI2.3]MEB0023019.1 hypothetical protein [Actimicrobium sp. CCI2.3]
MPYDTTTPIHPHRRRSSDRIEPVAPPRRKPATTTVGVVIMLLLHALVLWLIIYHQSDMPLPVQGSPEVETTLMLIPTTPKRSSRPTRPSGADVPAKPVAKPQRPAPQRQAAARPSRPRPAPEPTITQQPLNRTLPRPEPAQPPAEDFSSRLAARQQQRAEAQSQERETQAARGSPEQQENERGKQAALANIASSMKAAGIEKESGGGLFQLREVGAHNAEFLFRGWKKEAGRNWSQVLNVEQGSEEDVRIAVVKKMIEIIREHTQDDFTWQSQRLGKTVTLSAKPADSAGLQQFLLREFFPNYSPPRR